MTTTPTAAPRDGAAVPEVSTHEVVIVGTGFAGLGAAIKLREAGVTDVVLLERGDDVGGTWRDNTYPGAACDVPSMLYSFSFAPNPDWSRSFSPQEEIQAYLQRVAREYDVLPACRFGTTVRAARWDDAQARWLVETDHGTYAGRFLVPAVGGLSEPALPAIPGLDRFPGTIFHSARWDHTHDLTGERVAVVGTGASAIQIVPQLAPQVDRLHVFQRTPAWVVPRWDRALTRLERWLYRTVPAIQRIPRAAIYAGREWMVLGLSRDPRLMRIAGRLAEKHLRDQVADPQLRATLTPSFTIGCKRILISNDWYPTLQRDDVELVDAALAQVRGSTLVAADGREREVDTIVLATGFEVAEPPIAHYVWGQGGRSLADAWSDGARAYLGTSVSGFPNMFLVIGPNTGLGHTSMVVMIEAQIRYLVDAITTVRAGGAPAVDVREDVLDAYDREIQRKLAGTVWNTGGCASWYLDRNGRNSTIWPDFTFRFRARTRRFDPTRYRVVDPAREEERVPA